MLSLVVMRLSTLSRARLATALPTMIRMRTASLLVW